MFQFRKKDVKAKSLRLRYENLIERLELLSQHKEKYLSTFSNEQKEQVRQQTQTIIGIKYENPFIEINGKKYDLSKSEFHESIVQDMQKLSIEIDNQASHIINLRPMSSIEFYLLINSMNVSDNLHFGSADICTICQFELFEIDDWKDYQKINSNHQVVVGLPCDHYYHLDCLNYCIKEQHIQCPVCGKIYGVKTGDQPDGEMTYNIEYNTHCETYENVGTIIINYVMHAGQRNGQYFPATYREAFLPDTPEGRQVFRLLKLAFERKLIFTVGRSVTTGKDNRIVWNGIHHKTSLHGGISCFGYPDPTYFSRVKEELAAKGVY